MAGNAKPNIVKAEVTPTVLGGQVGSGSSIYNLFDGNLNNYCSFGWFAYYYIDLLIPHDCNIWRYGNSSTRTLAILKYNGSSYIDVSARYQQPTYVSSTWQKIVSKLPAGQYRFLRNIYDTINEYEWYLEEATTPRYLIKQNDKYYSIKDNTLTLLGIPTDDTLKQSWFETYGIENFKGSLKTALLTPDSSGNKLIDSLDSKFEVRMMKAKG